jgi:hypothetical protein
VAPQSPFNRSILMVNCFWRTIFLGPEGQTVLEKFEYGSASKNLGFKR